MAIKQEAAAQFARRPLAPGLGCLAAGSDGYERTEGLGARREPTKPTGRDNEPKVSHLNSALMHCAILCGMKPIALNTYDFPELRRAGQVYVDKTAWLHTLIADPNSKFFFISRPRRFGKSLMISTLQAIFEGRKELFEDLAIAKTDYDWEPHRVLRFDFSKLSVKSEKLFDEDLRLAVKDAVQLAGLKEIPPDRRTAGQIFDYAMTRLSQMYGPLVILIDEYDAPISHALTRSVELAEAIRVSLAGFYILLKGCMSSIRFLMATGVTKFNQASLFSALNNIKDLSMDEGYADMLGYTEEELTACFDGYMRRHAERMGLPYETYRAELKRWYDGYRFSPKSFAHVYNPVAIAMALTSKPDETGNADTFEQTWTTTGPTSLLTYSVKRGDLLQIQPDEDLPVQPALLGAVTDLSAINAKAILFQAGYLTLADPKPDRKGLWLAVPNEEVRRDYEALYLNQIVRRPDGEWQSDFREALLKGRPEDALPLLKDLFAGLPYSPTESILEANYRRLMMVLFPGYERRAEEPNSAGKRSDLVLTFPDYVYVIEFKNTATDTADSAIAQIKDRGYAKPYLHSGKTVYAMGLAFDPKDRTLKDAKAERLS